MLTKLNNTLDSVAELPEQIVLLEETDLYRYHLHSHERLQRPAHQTAHGHDTRVPSPLLTASEPSYHAPESVNGLDRDAMQFGLHATPFPPSLNKPSVTSMNTAAYSSGALRPGGSVDLLRREHIGFLLNWFLVGFFNTSVQAIVYPLLDTYLAFNDTQLNAAFALLKLATLFKFPAGFLSDCIPINRQRRKPYIFIGWTLMTLSMFTMVFKSDPLPYKKDDHVVYKDAASQGTRYVIPLMVGTFAHLLVAVVLEGMMIECSQRETEFVRGRAFSLCMIYRLTGEVLGGLATAFALNSHKHGGTFTAAVPLPVIFAFHGLLAVSGIAITKLCFLEERTSTSTQRLTTQLRRKLCFLEERTSTSTQRLTTQLRRIWNVLQQRTTWQIMVFGFCERLGSSCEIQEYRRIYIDWLGANSLTLNIIDPVSSSGVLLAVWLFKRFFLNSNWRKLIVFSVVSGLLVMVPVDILTVFAEVRDPNLYMGKGHLVSFTDAWFTIVRTVIIVAVAEPGYEAVTFGIFTTVFNLAFMVVSMGKNLAAAGVDSSETDLKLDTHVVRWHVMYEFLFKYGHGAVCDAAASAPEAPPPRAEDAGQLIDRDPSPVLHRLCVSVHDLFHLQHVGAVRSNLVLDHRRRPRLLINGGHRDWHCVRTTPVRYYVVVIQRRTSTVDGLKLKLHSRYT